MNTISLQAFIPAQLRDGGSDQLRGEILYAANIYRADLIAELKELAGNYPLVEDWREPILLVNGNDVVSDIATEFDNAEKDYFQYAETPKELADAVKEIRCVGDSVDVHDWARDACQHTGGSDYDSEEERRQTTDLFADQVIKIYEAFQKSRSYFLNSYRLAKSEAIPKSIRGLT